jgi:PAS domain S-box-containing protein
MTLAVAGIALWQSTRLASALYEVGSVRLPSIEDLRRTQLMMIVSAGLGVLGAMLLGWSLGRRLASPIAEMADALARVADGDLNARVPVRSRDELGVMAETMNRTIEALRSSEARLRALGDNLPNGMIYQIIRDHDGTVRFLFVSAGIERLNGLEPEAVLRKPSLFFRQILPEYVPLVLERREESFRTMGIFNADVRLRRMDGEIRWMHLSSAPRRLPDGRVLWDGIEMDITERVEAEEQLRASEERFRSALHDSPIGMAIVGTDGRWLDVNPALCDIVGYSREEMLSGTFYAITHPDDRAVDRTQVQRMLAGETNTHRTDKRYLHKDGRVVWVQLNTFLVRSSDGSPLHFVSHMQDITARRRAQQELAASEALLRQFIKHIPAAIAMLDRDMRYLQASDRWLKDYNLEDQDIIGRSHYDVFRTIPERWKEVHRRALAGSVEGCDQDEFEREDGSIEWLHWKIHPWHDAGGEIGGIIMFTQVITERRRIETALEQQRLLLESIVNAASDGIITTDESWRIVLFNPAAERIFGHRAKDVLGNGIELLVPERARRALTDELLRLERNKVETGVPTIDTGLRSNGEVFPLEAVVSAIRPGQHRRFAVTCRDLTARRRAEEARLNLEMQLQQAQKMEAIGTLAGGIAHDFNNILTTIMGHAELLKLGLPEHAQRESVEAIVLAGGRASALVRQILAFSRKQQQQRELIRLDGVLDEATQLLRASLPAAIAIETIVEPDSATVLADPMQIQQVIMNLAANAVYAMGSSGELTFTLGPFHVDTAFVRAHPSLRTGDYMRLSVADNGAGIAADTIERIWEPFFTTKPPGEGTGLGLSVVLGILQSHDGAITVDSGTGRGTTFDLYFPIVTSPTEQATVAVIERVPLGSGQRILFVDDEPAIARLAGTMLERLGYAPTLFGSATQALSALGADPGGFDALITDLSMPGMSGVALASKALEIRPDLTVVLATGYAGELDTARAHELGLHAVLTKPYSLDALARGLEEGFRVAHASAQQHDA